MAADTRQRILSALRDIVVRGGTDAVTLEAVAAEAGVSKGGLLYHFPSKSDLYLGLLRAVRDAVAQGMVQATARSGAPRGFLEYAEPTSEGEAGFFSSLIAVVRTGQSGESERTNDEARQLLVDIFRAWEDPMRAVVGDPVQAELIRLVGYGLYLTELVGLPPIEPGVLAQVIDRLLAGIPSPAAAG